MFIISKYYICFPIQRIEYIALELMSETLFLFYFLTKLYSVSVFAKST